MWVQLLREGLLPAWLLLSVLFSLRRPELRGAWVQGCIGLILYSLLRLGLHAVRFSGHMAIVGLAMAIPAHALLFGWAVSTAGSRLLWTPIGTAIGRWPDALHVEVQGGGGSAAWGSLSTKLALAILVIDLLVVIQIVRCTPR